MTVEATDRPGEHEIEVSLFGPGFGECVVIHLGANRWVVVDSCLAKESKRAAALNYFDRLGVNPAASVELIVCTHWHDDHIRGVASVLSESPNAQFCCSSALRESAFLELVALGEEIRGPHGSGLQEIEKVLKQIQGRRARGSPAKLRSSKVGDVLLDAVIDETRVRITALSPSSEDDLRMSNRFRDKKEELLAGDYRSAVSSIHPNLGSVVLRVEIGHEFILLGADMEHRESKTSGWNAIISTIHAAGLSSLYKIAHHGSKTGDTAEIWEKLLVANCLSILTPNQRLAHAIPKPGDVERILSRTEYAYATAPSGLRRKGLSQPAEKLFRRKGIKVHESPSSQGHLRIRKSMSGNAAWTVSMFGRAFRLPASAHPDKAADLPL